MTMVRILLLFVILNFVTIVKVVGQNIGCRKNKITIKSYQINNVSIAKIDSFISKSKPFKIEVDSFSNNRKVSTRTLDGEKTINYKWYRYNLKGNLIKIVNKLPASNFKGDSTVYTYDNVGRILSITPSEGLDENHIYSTHFNYKNGKTYLTDLLNGKAVVTTVFWRNKNQTRQYRRVINGEAKHDFYLERYDKHGQVVSEEECLNNKCTVVLSYIIEYNSCGNMTRKLSLSSENKIFNAITYDIE